MLMWEERAHCCLLAPCNVHKWKHTLFFMYIMYCVVREWERASTFHLNTLHRVWAEDRSTLIFFLCIAQYALWGKHISLSSWYSIFLLHIVLCTNRVAFFFCTLCRAQTGLHFLLQIVLCTLCTLCTLCCIFLLHIVLCTNRVAFPPYPFDWAGLYLSTLSTSFETSKCMPILVRNYVIHWLCPNQLVTNADLDLPWHTLTIWWGFELGKITRQIQLPADAQWKTE
jgi:hypothetical protein